MFTVIDQILDDIYDTQWEYLSENKYSELILNKVIQYIRLKNIQRPTQYEIHQLYDLKRTLLDLIVDSMVQHSKDLLIDRDILTYDNYQPYLYDWNQAEFLLTNER